MRAPASLVERACAGDPAAVSKLLAVCQPDLRRFARRTCGSTEDAEDAVQVALWQLYRKIGMLRTVEAFTSWLFRIVERECFRMRRRMFGARVGAAPMTPLPNEAAVVEELPADPIPVDLRLDLTAAIAALPEPARVVLILRDVHQLTAPEVAAQLGLSVDAVKSRLHRARAQVRDQLMASGYWAPLAREGREGRDSDDAP